MKFAQSDKKIWVISLCFILLIGYLLLKVNTLEKMGSAARADTNLTVQADDHIRGATSSQIIIFEFSDYECPFCEKLHPELKRLISEYDGKVAWVYKHFPLSSHLNAQEKAEIAECVGILNGNEAFWDFTDAVFEGGTQISVEQVRELSENKGVSEINMNNCLNDKKMRKKILNDKKLGEEYGVSGTPGSVILNTETGKTTLIPGALPYESFKTIIDGMLNQ